jgi:hypothetical protein
MTLRRDPAMGVGHTFTADRIHHFDHEPHRDWDGLKHGVFQVHTQLVLSGWNVFYLPAPRRFQ